MIGFLIKIWITINGNILYNSKIPWVLLLIIYDNKHNRPIFQIYSIRQSIQQYQYNRLIQFVGIPIFSSIKIYQQLTFRQSSIIILIEQKMSRARDVALIQQLTPDRIREFSYNKVCQWLGLSMPLSTEERQQCQSQIALIQERYDFLKNQRENKLRARQIAILPSVAAKNQTSEKPEHVNQRHYLTRFWSVFQQVGSQLLKPKSDSATNTTQLAGQARLDQRDQGEIRQTHISQHKKFE